MRLILEPWTPCRAQTPAHKDHLPVGLKKPLPRCSESLSPRHLSIWEPDHPSQERPALALARSAALCPPRPLMWVQCISRRSRKKLVEGDVLEIVHVNVSLRGPAHHGVLPRDESPTALLWV